MYARPLLFTTDTSVVWYFLLTYVQGQACSTLRNINRYKHCNYMIMAEHMQNVSAYIYTRYHCVTTVQNTNINYTYSLINWSHEMLKALGLYISIEIYDKYVNLAHISNFIIRHLRHAILLVPFRKTLKSLQSSFIYRCLDCWNTLPAGICQTIVFTDLF